MQPFAYTRAGDAAAAVAQARAAAGSATAVPPADHASASAQFLGGGTTLLDLMKLGVMQPSLLVDIGGLTAGAAGRISAGTEQLRLGALVSMAEAAGHAAICRDYPVLSQALSQAASPQLRNMARLGGNVLQRTRCPYFRDTGWACNKRNPGSGCAALDGQNRLHAVLGTSDQCIASYPGDFANALLALDAQVEILGPDGPRSIPFGALHCPPGDRPQRETVLEPGDLITAFTVPARSWNRRSLFLKIRDRESYAFALASAAVALDLDGGRVVSAGIALGGVATVPWRAVAAETVLLGRELDEGLAQEAAEAAFAEARPRTHNAFKLELGKRCLVRALLQVAELEI